MAEKFEEFIVEELNDEDATEVFLSEDDDFNVEEILDEEELNVRSDDEEWL